MREREKDRNEDGRTKNKSAHGRIHIWERERERAINSDCWQMDFSILFIKFVTRYKKIDYNIDILRQTACIWRLRPQSFRWSAPNYMYECCGAHHGPVLCVCVCVCVCVCFFFFFFFFCFFFFLLSSQWFWLYMMLHSRGHLRGPTIYLGWRFAKLQLCTTPPPPPPPRPPTQ